MRLQTYIFLVMFMSSLSMVMAQDLSNIDAQITQIQNAPASKRVELMNAFKLRLMQMNVQQREEAIAHLQESMQNSLKHENIVHTQEIHVQTIEDLGHMQNSNQLHAGDQYIHEELPTVQTLPIDKTESIHNNLFGHRE